MALSMEERRILAEIESHLAEEDPKLAERLSGLSHKRQRSRIRFIAAVAVAAIAVLIAIVSAIVSGILTAIS